MTKNIVKAKILYCLSVYLVLIMNSLARSCGGEGSKRFSLMDLSKGSPGSNSQESNTLKQKAYPDV